MDKQPMTNTETCPNDCLYNLIPEKICAVPSAGNEPFNTKIPCKQYHKADTRQCKTCGWHGRENETGFGHNDFYCPKCLTESLS